MGDFYAHHKINRQTFLKYYHHFTDSGDEAALLPQKRGPKWKARRAPGFVEQQVLGQRALGNNRYEIYAILQPQLGSLTPSASALYRILRDHDMNRLKPPQKANKRRIMKHLAGQLGHIDCHHLGRDMMVDDSRRRYLVCLLDDCARLAWARVVDDLTALTVMFASKNRLRTHPFERLPLELGIKHRYTRPYRPQTNGKVERFWRTLNQDLIEDTTFDNADRFQTELQQYLLYDNEHRPHQALGAKTPKQMNQNGQRIGELYSDDKGWDG
ncbi:MAG: integrase core domain-containing protein [Gammaproteobacteria bacterium]|nr:integrase core domain-containing protein [Gammaproteobacteria bacterium]